MLLHMPGGVHLFAKGHFEEALAQVDKSLGSKSLIHL